MTLNNLENKQNDCRNYETESFLIGVDGSFKIHTEPPTSSAIETVFEIMRTEDEKIVYNIEKLLYFNSEQEEAIFWQKCIDSLINYVGKGLNYNFKKIPIMPLAYSQNMCYVINRLLKLVIDNDNMQNQTFNTVASLANCCLTILQDKRYDTIEDLINEVSICVLVMLISTNLDLTNLDLQNINI